MLSSFFIIYLLLLYGGHTRIKNPQNLDFAESEERGGKTQKQTEFVLSISLLSEQVTLDYISLFRRFAPYKSDSRHHAAKHRLIFQKTA